MVPYDVFAETVNMVGKEEDHAKSVDVTRLLLYLAVPGDQQFACYQASGT